MKKNTQFVVRSSSYSDGSRNFKVKQVKYPAKGGLFKKNKDLYKLPLVIRKHVREWCEVNSIIFGEHPSHGDYIIWNDIIEGKKKLIRLYLNYFQSSEGKQYVFAHNQMFKRRINVNHLMAGMNQVEEFLDRALFYEQLDGSLEYCYTDEHGHVCVNYKEIARLKREKALKYEKNN